MKKSNDSEHDTDKEELGVGYQFGGKVSKKKTRFSTSTWMADHYRSLLWIWIKTLILSVLFCSRHRLCRQALDKRNIKQFRTTMRRVSGNRTNTKRKSNEQKFSCCEIKSHANTIVVGSNCVILQYIGKECNVKPYWDDYESVSNIPIVNADTSWQSTHTVQTHIIVFNEVLWMGNYIYHSLVNPNQLRYYGIKVQDDPMLYTTL